MARLDYATQRLTAKIVYYGPGLCGKTTNLQSIHAQLPEDVRGKMLAFATKEDRTLIFDFLPVDLGDVRGLDTRIQLYTVPGQVFYNETRKLVLKGTDGIIFVADSQQQLMGANVESMQNLEENLKGHGTCLAEIPHVIQYNKQDLPQLSSVDEMNATLNIYNAPYFTSVATDGTGVLQSLRGIVKLVLADLTRRLDSRISATTEASAIALL